MSRLISVSVLLLAYGAALAQQPPIRLRQTAERGVHLDLGDFELRLNPGQRSASRYTTLGIYRANGRISE